MRRQLLQWLFIGIAFSSALIGVLVNLYVRVEMDELYNAHMRQLATILAGQLDSAGEVGPARIADSKKKSTWAEEDYVIQIWDKRGRLISADAPVVGLSATTVPLQEKPGLHVRHLMNESWRIFRADSPHILVQVAQPEAARRITITEISLRILLPLLLQIPLLALLAWGAVRRGLLPLERLSQAIAQRQPYALTPLNTRSLAADLQPLVLTLNALLERLDLALKQQRNFIADAAHELRTPLATLQLQLDLLERAQTDADRSLAMAELRNGIDRATHLIRQLLRIAHSEASQPTTEVLSVPLQACGTEAIERHLPSAHARNIDLGVTRLDPVSIRCTPAEAETVLDNLLSNAIRYTPAEGRIDLAIYPEGDRAIIEVTDTGIGIPEEERKRIFDRFYRVLTTSGGAIEGSGLGLAIVKTICERYGASIAVGANEQGPGTRFRLSWPMAAAD